MNNDQYDNMVELAKSLENGMAAVQAENLARVLKLNYDAFLAQGFNEHQALALVLEMVAGARRS